MDIKAMQKRLREACNAHMPYCFSNGECPLFRKCVLCAEAKCGNNYEATLKAYNIMFKEDKKMGEPKIIIMQDKDDRTKVVARRFDTGETAFAKCSPDDTFDFVIGAKLAMERLCKPKPRFKVGDRVVANSKAKGHYTITVPGWRGTVVHAWDDRIDVKGPGRFGIGTFVVASEHFDLDTSPAYYTGEVVCVKNGGFDHWTPGKVYTILNGIIKDDDGDDRRIKYKTVEHLNNSMRGHGIEFIEFKGK